MKKSKCSNFQLENKEPKCRGENVTTKGGNSDKEGSGQVKYELIRVNKISKR